MSNFMRQEGSTGVPHQLGNLPLETGLVNY